MKTTTRAWMVGNVLGVACTLLAFPSAAFDLGDIDAGIDVGQILTFDDEDYPDPAANQLCADSFVGPDRMRYCSNRPLFSGSANVSRVVIVIPGSGSPAKMYYDNVLALAQQEHVDASTTIIVPQFLEDDGEGKTVLQKHGLSNDYAYWASGWRQGSKAKNANKTSSFAMVDFIVEKVVERNPNLWHIAVVGHSAGGQFVNRYAAGTAIPGWALNRVQQKQDPDTGQFVQRGVTMSFGVSSAGSFLYFDHDRPKYTWEQRQLLLALFGADPIQQSCPTYNDYKYGLDGLNSYMNNSTESELKFRAISRHVRYFVGEKDDKLDTGCQVTVQGENHVVRMENYEAHLEHICQSLGPMCDVFNFRSARRFTVVPGVGHDSKLLFGSAVGRSILFRDE